MVTMGDLGLYRDKLKTTACLKVCVPLGDGPDHMDPMALSGV